ncbi:MAG TPA: TetR/AcrR family transcriptional regulator [Solirubrobacteraceae bacterium]|nr:TetR/AcrR family transcriptional regulator [Solirubrobacteraceae bacterium]
MVADIQRSRLLAATVAVLEERGYEHATVAHITHRARVSRRTFYEQFANREQCVAAVLSEIAERVCGELRDAGLAELSWRERTRGGLWAILCFLEHEPALGRVLVVHALRGSGPVLKAREEIVKQLVAVVDEGRRESARGTGVSALTAEGVVGAAFAILHTRLAERTADAPRLRGLLGELAAIVVLPYLGAAAARCEQSRPLPASPRRAAAHTANGSQVAAGDPLGGLRMRFTYRTARVLEGVQRCPGASNRQVADHAGIADQGQVSKLLARLERLGLLVNQRDRERPKGEPNRWSLTPTGAQVAGSISAHVDAGVGRHAT